MIWQVILWEPKWPWMMWFRKCLQKETELLGAFTIYWIVANVIMESWMTTSILHCLVAPSLVQVWFTWWNFQRHLKLSGASQFDPRFFSLESGERYENLSQNEGLLKSIGWFLRLTRFHLPFLQVFFVWCLEVLIEKLVAIGFGHHHDTGDRKAHSGDRNNHSYSCFPTVDSPLSPILPVANQLANNEKNLPITGAGFCPSRSSSGCCPLCVNKLQKKTKLKMAPTRWLECSFLLEMAS